MSLDLSAFTTLGPLVVALRQRAKLSLKELATRAGISYWTLSKVENDKKTDYPSAAKLEKIGQVTGASPEEIAAMLRLAGKAPAGVQQWAREEPAVVELYRSIQGMAPAEQSAFLQGLVAEVRAKLGLPTNPAQGLERDQ